MKDFWEKQSSKNLSFIHSISNLSYDKDFSKEKSEKEQKEILKILNNFNKKFNSSLEIGAGTCQWTNLLCAKSKNVLATDISKGMLNLGIKYMQKNFPKYKVEYFFGDIIKDNKPINSPFDLIFISGLLLYQNNEEFLNLLKFIKQNSETNAILILREPIGIHKEFSIKNKYSQELKTNYSALYRTEKDIIKNICKNSFSLLTSKWFHTDGSKFNKWKETRLKLMTFRRI
tara:strand:+ start:4537 stop:5226 length:690 start_codon:yes stop_codon:yes gene_type:complete